MATNQPQPWRKYKRKAMGWYLKGVVEILRHFLDDESEDYLESREYRVVDSSCNALWKVARRMEKTDG